MGGLDSRGSGRSGQSRRSGRSRTGGPESPACQEVQKVHYFW